MTPGYVYAGITTAFAWALLRLWKGAEHKPFPPGPKPKFLLGNLFDFPIDKPWLRYTEWKQLYGDVVYMSVFGRSIVVLNSFKVAKDLLDKRSLIYSDRPQSVMLTELVGWQFSLSVMNYTPRWRIHRKLFHRHFNGGAIYKYRPCQERAIHTLLHSLLNDPEHFLDHLRMSFASSIMDTLYGIRIKSPDDIFVKTAEEALKGAAAATTPGAFLVDILPFLKYVPAWVPGAGFQKKAAEWRIPTLRLRNLPVEYAREQIEQGTATPSVFVSLLDTPQEERNAIESNEGVTGSFEDIAANVAGVGYAAGADTTLSLTQAFFLAMAKFPDVQKRAQEELDCILGNESRLPTFEDAKDLAYVRAVIKELLRWHSPGPLGIPHALSEDDVYEGYLLPKGSIVMANVWGILNDPEMFPDPRTFDPSRWFDKTAEGLEMHDRLLDPREVTFGFGRRVCQGRYFAEESLFLMVSCVLACFNISPPVDEFGEVKVLDGEVTGGALSYPVPFQVRITPRTRNAVRLIEETGIHS